MRGSAASTIIGGSVLRTDESTVRPGVVRWSGTTIAEIGDDSAAPTTGPVIDATGAWVLPGLIDLHGDAFERSLMPRGGVSIDIDLALADNDAQLAAAGITTSFLSATDSWEPGLRSRATLRTIVDALSRHRSGPELALHVRHERGNIDDPDELEGWIRDGTVGLLSYNDHTPGGIVHITGITAGQSERAGVDAAILEEMQAHAIERRAVGADQERRLAEVAREAGCATASHDADDEGDLRRDLELGVTIAEFPTSIPLAHRYRDSGITVLLGAPNLVRGGSHLGGLSVAEAIEAGVGDALCSDYHYPSLLQAPFVLAQGSEPRFAAAWKMVSARPAEAAGLGDRGELRPGARADIVVVEPPVGRLPARVRATVVGGRVVQASDAGVSW